MKGYYKGRVIDEVEYMEDQEREKLRYYMSRHAIKIIFKKGKKALICHLEKGYVGNKTEGYKKVIPGDGDICLIRCCRRNKK